MKIDFQRQAWFAEFWGTFMLVLAGTGAIIIQNQTGVITHVGIAITFGLIIFVGIETFGNISGAHFNPAVTLALTLAGEFTKSRSIPYILAQCSGAISASVLLRILFPKDEYLGSTNPAGSDLQSFILELLLTWFLVLVIFSLTDRRGQGGASGKSMISLTIGAVIGLEAMFAGPICGASMNPARSLAPALISNHLNHLWIYLLAPTLGGILAIPIWRSIRA